MKLKFIDRDSAGNKRESITNFMVVRNRKLIMAMAFNDQVRIGLEVGINMIAWTLSRLENPLDDEVMEKVLCKKHMKKMVEMYVEDFKDEFDLPDKKGPLPEAPNPIA